MATLGDDFLGMFADIEQCIRADLGKPQSGRFMDLAREYVAKHNLPSSYLISLHTYASLRNAIDHNSHHGTYPIAEPIPDIVEEIRQLRGKIKEPPKAISILPAIGVCAVQSSEPVSMALEYVRRFDFSQLPVYDSGLYTGILTTNTIARWLAQQISDGTDHRDATISEVMKFCEPGDFGLLVDQAISVADAIHELAYGGPGGGSVNALIVTDSKLPTDRPIRVIAVHDIPLLSAALKFT